MLVSIKCVLRGWQKYYEELMTEENKGERETSGDGVKMVNQQVWRISKNKVWSAMMRMPSGKAVGPNGIPEKVWR